MRPPKAEDRSHKARNRASDKRKGGERQQAAFAFLLAPGPLRFVGHQDLSINLWDVRLATTPMTENP
jgi:hypothetical protein